MSLAFTGGVAFTYAAGVIGVHRFAVWRRRARAQNYPSLDWLDWDALLAGVWSSGASRPAAALRPLEGGPAPLALSSAPLAPEKAAAFSVLTRLVQGAVIDGPAFIAAGFSESEARWLALLAARTTNPDRLLERVAATVPRTAAEAVFREYLSLTHAVTPLSVEWQVYASKRRLSAALRRFGDVPALYFARARASSLLGFTQGVLDDVARAVFFSREAPFYVEAVVAMPFVHDARPPLARACQAAQERLGAQEALSSNDKAE